MLQLSTLRLVALSLLCSVGGIRAGRSQGPSLSGSSGVAIRLGDRIVIGTDGIGVYENANGLVSTITTCKVVWSDQVAFIHTGLDQDRATGFDIVAIAHSIIDRSLPLLQKIKMFRDAMILALQASMKRMKKNELERYKRQYLDRRIIDTAFAAFENGTPILYSLVFNVNEERGHIVVSTKQIVCPGDCPNGTGRLFLGESGAMARLEASNSRFYDNMIGAVRSLIQAEIDDPRMKGHVGPPISILILTAAGPQWAETGACVPDR